MTNTIRLWRRTFITLSHDYGSMLHASYAILGHLRKSWYVSGVMGEQDEGQCGSVSKEKNPKGGGYDHEASGHILRDLLVQGRDFSFYFQCDGNSWEG